MPLINKQLWNLWKIKLGWKQAPQGQQHGQSLISDVRNVATATDQLLWFMQRKSRRDVWKESDSHKDSVSLSELIQPTWYKIKHFNPLASITQASGAGVLYHFLLNLILLYFEEFGNFCVTGTLTPKLGRVKTLYCCFHLDRHKKGFKWQKRRMSVFCTA